LLERERKHEESESGSFTVRTDKQTRRKGGTVLPSSQFGDWLIGKKGKKSGCAPMGATMELRRKRGGLKFFIYAKKGGGRIKIKEGDDLHYLHRWKGKKKPKRPPLVANPTCTKWEKKRKKKRDA